MTNAGIDFYHQLARRNLTTSLRDYSCRYLGMAENYACLRGDRAGQHSIRINQQWRICFTWTDAGPVDVEIVDYH